MKSKIIFCFLFVLVILLVLTGCVKGTNKYDAFAKCLTEKGVKMYGTDWCPHCKNQKKMFSDSFQYIDYIDCDWNKDLCSKMGIKSYPTWIIDGKSYRGEQRLERLSSLTSCELVGAKVE